MSANQVPPSYIREHTAGSIIRSTSRLYFGNFLPLYLIFLIPTIPGHIWAVIDGIDSLPAVLLLSIGGFFALPPMTVAVSDICLGNRPRIGRAFGRLKSTLLPLIGTVLLLYFLMIVGFLLFIIPGLIVAVLMLFALVVVVLESRTGVAALRRSRELGKGSYMRNFGILFLILLTVQLCILILGAIVGVIVGVTSQSMETIEVAAALVGAILGSVGGPLYTIPIVLLYYDMRVRKENYDAAALASDIVA